MPFSWKDSAEGGMAEKIPVGTHMLTIARILFEDKNGPLRSNNGDPKIRLILSDSESREAMINVTLSPSAGWVLSRIVKASKPELLDEWDAAGMDIADMQYPETALNNLVGLKFKGVVSLTTGNDGKEYLDIQPVIQKNKSTLTPEPMASAPSSEGQSKATNIVDALKAAKNAAWAALKTKTPDMDDAQRKQAWADTVRAYTPAKMAIDEISIVGWNNVRAKILKNGPYIAPKLNRAELESDDNLAPAIAEDDIPF